MRLSFKLLGFNIGADVIKATHRIFGPQSKLLDDCFEYKSLADIAYAKSRYALQYLHHSYALIIRTDGNRLRDFDVGRTMPNLRVLRISMNKLTKLDCSKFAELRTLYADGNRLSRLLNCSSLRRLHNLSMRNQLCPSVLVRLCYVIYR